MIKVLEGGEGMRQKVAILLIMLTIAAVVSAWAGAAALAQETRVEIHEGGQVRSVIFVVDRAEYFINGQVPGIKMDAKPFIQSGRTFVPIRYLAYGLGVPEKDVSWDQKAQQVTLKRQGVEAKFTVGKKAVLINGQIVPIDVSPILKKEEGRTYLPARYVAEALKYWVDWYPDDRLVVCWPWDEVKPESDVAVVRQYVNPPKDDSVLAQQIWDKAKPFSGEPVDHSAFSRQSWLVERAEKISFITLQDLPARVGSHVIVDIDLSQAATELNRIKTKQVALGSVSGGGYVTPADLILWRAPNNDLGFEIAMNVPSKQHILEGYYPLYNVKPADIKYFVFASGGELLAVKNPLYKGE